MKKILGRKGFTLVECIIAVAVFGLLSLIVFMILTNASVRSSKASESEENLAQLIENVVGDDTYKKYDASSPSLKLLIDNVGGTAYSGTNDFEVSYNVISGYKNFIECNPLGTMTTSCGHQANFTEFMSSASNTMVPVTSTLFNVNTCFFVCPHCNKPQNALTLKCPDCSTTGAYNAASSTSPSGKLFNYLSNATGGGFECSACGSTAVMAVDSAGNYISEKVSADGFSISGMVANGIRYGEQIDWDTEHADDLTNNRIAYFRKINPSNPQIAGADFDSGQIRIGLKYAGSANATYAGEYTLRLYVNPSSLAPGESFNTDIVFPIGYSINLKTTSPNVTVTEGPLPNSTSTKSYPILRVTQTGPGTIPNISFTLTSKESGYSFEYDYNRNLSLSENDTKQGLFRWFKLTPSGASRSAEDYLISSDSSDYFILNN